MQNKIKSTDFIEDKYLSKEKTKQNNINDNKSEENFEIFESDNEKFNKNNLEYKSF